MIWIAVDAMGTVFARVAFDIAMAYRFASNRFIERVEQDIAAAAAPHH